MKVQSMVISPGIALKILLIICFFAVSLVLFLEQNICGQEPPYLFTVVTKQPASGQWLVNTNTGYGVRTTGTFGSDGFEQRVGVRVGLSKRLSLSAGGGLLISRDSYYKGESASAELLAHIIRADRFPVELMLGGGINRDYDGVTSILTRVVMGKRLNKWDISSNAYFEKPFDSMRDKVDVVTVLGISRQMHRLFRCGIEIIAEDLEGLWEKEEAEGGAKALIGPTFHFNGIHKNIFLTFGGGRVLYLTESSASSQALRLLPTIPGRDGFVIRAAMTYIM